MLWKQTSRWWSARSLRSSGGSDTAGYTGYTPTQAGGARKRDVPAVPADTVRQPVALAPTERRPVTLPLAISEGLAADPARARRRL